MVFSSQKSTSKQDRAKFSSLDTVGVLRRRMLIESHCELGRSYILPTDHGNMWLFGYTKATGKKFSRWIVGSQTSP